MSSYCIRCGKENEKRDWAYVCGECGYSLYRHSYPTASVFVVRKDKVLMSVRGVEPKKGKLDLVGGFLNYGEDPRDGAIRECLEETGLNLEIIDLLGIYIDDYENQGEMIKTLNVVYVGEAEGEPREDDDVAELLWVGIDEMPKNFAFKMVAPALEDLRNWYKGKKEKN